jgi:cytochrome oxidase Cu insertion factor (SCO1/SenC/PrrC family)
MSWKLIRILCIPAFALFLTLKLYGWILGDAPQKNVTEQSSGEAAIGGKFVLVNQDSKIVADSDYRGKLMLVYFGFTNCPDVCPVDLALISNVMTGLEGDARHVQPVFITVDPKRDAPKVLKQFLGKFYPGIVGLTGSQVQIDEVVGKYRIFAKKVETAEATSGQGVDANKDVGAKTEDAGHHHHGGYMMEHSAYIYLMGRDGKYITHFSNKQDEAEIVAKIKGSL